MNQEDFTLVGDSSPLQLEESGITLVAPGLFGKGSAHPRRPSAGGRTFLGERDEVAQAIDESGAEDRFTLTIDAPTPAAAAGGRGAGGVADDEMLMQVPLAADEAAYLMYVDEAGVISFHYADASTQASPLPSRAFSAAKQSSFRIPLRKGEAKGGGDGRGLFAKVTSKIVKVVVVKLFPGAVGSAVARAVRAWEEKFRGNGGLHGGSWAQLLDKVPTPATDLTRAAGKRSLLLVHGTTSSTAGAFAGLKEQEALLERLRKHYDGRVFGLNHHTMSRSVAENVQQFVDAFAGAPGEYTFDVICHSRGGLLARALAAAGGGATPLTGTPCTPPAGVHLTIDRIAFVATPNAGTALAEPKGIPGLVERLTNVVNQLPDSGLVIAAGALMSLAGAAVEAALPRLPGLADQVPGSELQKELGALPARHERYFALSSDYEPKGSLIDVVKAKAMDRIFGATRNDLVVPTEGVGVTPYFQLPEERSVRFGVERGVHHSLYFRQAEIGRLVGWLEAG
jgi:pimeloyl-ACP methyl ester carboxylesterase